MLGHCAQSVGGALPGAVSIAIPELIYSGYVSGSDANSSGLIIPQHQPGDLIVVGYGQSTGNGSFPAITEPADFTAVQAAVGSFSSSPDLRRRVLTFAKQSVDGAASIIRSAGLTAAWVAIFRNAMIANSAGVGVSGSAGTTGAFAALPALILKENGIVLLGYYRNILVSVAGSEIIASGCAAISRSQNLPPATRAFTLGSSDLAFGVTIYIMGAR